MAYSNEEIAQQANAYANAFLDSQHTGTSFNEENQSDLVLQYIAEHHPTIRAERFHIEGKDHVFVVIGRDQNSDYSHPSTWGARAVICNLMTNKVYPAANYLQYLQAVIAGDEKASDAQKTLSFQRPEMRAPLRPVLGMPKTQNDMKKAMEKTQKALLDADIAYRKMQVVIKKTRQKFKAAEKHHIQETTLPPVHLTAMGKTANHRPGSSTPSATHEPDTYSPTAPNPFRTKPKKPTEI